MLAFPAQSVLILAVPTLAVPTPAVPILAVPDLSISSLALAFSQFGLGLEPDERCESTRLSFGPVRIVSTEIPRGALAAYGDRTHACLV